MKINKYKTGVIHGRFQILHNDHIKYLLAGKSLCEYLVIGITNPDPTLTKTDDTDLARSSQKSNPLTYYERFSVITNALIEKGLDYSEFAIVPFPINFPKLCKYYVPFDATFFLTIYDEWGEKKLKVLNELGLKTHILWRKPLSEKGISATQVRQAIKIGKPWEQLVPESTARYIKDQNIKNRL